MSKHTEKLNLYEIEKTIDTFSTFDIDTALNDNWEKIDQNVINKNGTVPFVCRQKGVDPVEDDDLATKRFVDCSISEIGQFYCIPYSVNSGAVDTNGCANFISKIDNTTIKILASTPIILTHPSGKQEKILADYTIGSITSDGTYIVVKEYGSNPVLTIHSMTESLVAPSSPTDGDYWLNISVRPYQPFKRVSGAWVATQFVKLGEFTRTSGTIVTPVSYAFNGKYKSNAISYPAAGTKTSFYHNIGSKNLKFKSFLLCIGTEYGYSVGDITNYGLTAYINWALPDERIVSNIEMKIGTGTYIADSNNFPQPLTPANWNIFVTAERNF